MVQRFYGEDLNFKKAQQRFDNLRTENCSRRLGTAPSIADRMDKMEKILSLMNSPYEGESVSAAKLAIKLSKAWGIDLGLLQDPSIKQEKSLADRGVQSGSAHFFSSHVAEFTGSEMGRRTPHSL